MCGWRCSRPRATNSTAALVVRCYGTARPSDDQDDEEALAEAFQAQKAKLDLALSSRVGFFGKHRMRGWLFYILQRNRDFDIDLFLEGAEMCFFALNEEMYSSESPGEPDFGAMASERIAGVLTQVMSEYQEQGIQMLTTASEPSGNILHSTKIASIDIVEDTPAPEFYNVDGADETDETGRLVEYVHVSVEYNATETIILVGADGKTVEGSGEDLAWQVEVGGQRGDPPYPNSSYV